MSKVSIDALASEVNKIMTEFETATDESIEKAMKTASKMAVEELKVANPAGSGKYGDWKEYNKGWKATKQSKKRKYPITYIHNATHYQLAHLLEKGHAIVNKKQGGRTKTESFEHIAPVAEKAEDLFFSEAVKEIK